MRVAIVGAGIGGLAAAHRLTELAAERGTALELLVVEASERAGGALATERVEGALLERGPDTLVTHKPAGLALCERLGLGPLITLKPAGQIDILDRGRLLPLPAGFALLAPTRARPLLTSPLLSWAGRLRALAEPLVPRRREEGDESVAAFVRRRFGREVYARMAEPVVGGLFMADCERLSLAATFPRFASLEHERGRLLGAGPTSRPGSAPQAATLEGGLGQIVDALLARLPVGSLRLHSPVARLARREQGFTLELGSGEAVHADAVLVALPAPAAAALVTELDAALARDLRQISYASCLTVNLAWPAHAVKHPPPCHGFFVPRSAGNAVVAASFVSTKFPERVPEGSTVVRAFLGGALAPEVIGSTEAELVELAARTLAPLLGTRESPAWHRVFREPGSMPQRTVGHPNLAARITARLDHHPGLAFAGGPTGAYGLPDSIAAGERAAERVVGAG